MEEKYFEIRLESIGGFGANLCGKLLGELGANYLNLNSTCFSSYGSEKTGSPVTSYIRWAPKGREILAVTPVVRPDIIGIFHEAMIDGKNVFGGAGSNTRIVINSKKDPEKLQEQLKVFSMKLYTVDCQNIATQCHSRMNMAMLGALVRAMDCVDMKTVCELLEKKFEQYGEQVVGNNLAAFRMGYEQVCCCEKKEDQDRRMDDELLVKSKWGYENAPIGGVNPVMGSTITNDLQPSRAGRFPVYIPEKCIHCGRCDMTCPDMVFRFEPGEYNKRRQMVNCGLDYHHCKGCLRCVEICPTHALVEGDEEKDKKRFSVRNKALIVGELDYEAKGANSMVMSESFSNDGSLRGGEYEE